MTIKPNLSFAEFKGEFVKEFQPGLECPLKTEIGTQARLLSKNFDRSAHTMDERWKLWLVKVGFDKSTAPVTLINSSRISDMARGRGDEELAKAIYYALHYNVEDRSYAHAVDMIMFDGPFTKNGKHVFEKVENTVGIGTLRNSPKMGLQFVQNDKVVNITKNDETYSVELKAEPFILQRILTPTHHVTEGSSFDVSIQTHDKLHGLTHRLARKINEVPDGLVFQLGVGFADHDYGSATLVCCDEVGSVEIAKDTVAIIAQWNVVAQNRMNVMGNFSYGAYFSSILNEERTEMIAPGTKLVFAITDFQNHSLFKSGMKLLLSARSFDFINVEFT